MWNLKLPIKYNRVRDMKVVKKDQEDNGKRVKDLLGFVWIIMTCEVSIAKSSFKQQYK